MDIFTINVQKQNGKIPIKDVKLVKEVHPTKVYLTKLIFHIVLLFILLATLLWVFYYIYLYDRKSEVRIPDDECPVVPPVSFLESFSEMGVKF